MPRSNCSLFSDGILGGRRDTLPGSLSSEINAILTVTLSRAELSSLQPENRSLFLLKRPLVQECQFPVNSFAASLFRKRERNLMTDARANSHCPGPCFRPLVTTQVKARK